MIIGIVGGIGSGKSAVARLFAEAGCPVIDADRIAHAALEDREVKARIRGRFGPGVFGEDGEVDRRAMAAAAFDSAEAVSALNGIVHPRVREEILEKIEEHLHDHPSSGGGPPGSVLVLDVSLLAFSPLRDRCDRIVFVEASEEVRRQRCRDRGWSAGELERRERHQAPLEAKRALAHWTIDNSGSLEETRRQVRRLLAEIEAGSGKGRVEERPRSGVDS